jgi:hypothetical protein
MQYLNDKQIKLESITTPRANQIPQRWGEKGAVERREEGVRASRIIVIRVWRVFGK